MRRTLTRFFSPDVVVERRVLWVAWAIQATALVAFLAIAILVIDPADDDPSTFVIAVEASLLGVYLLGVAASAILGMKRLQARGRSPWLSLVALVPFGGALWYAREVGFRTDRPGEQE